MPKKQKAMNLKKMIMDKMKIEIEPKKEMKSKGKKKY